MVTEITNNNERILTTGPTNFPTMLTGPPERKEINDLIDNDPIGFSLYVRALTAMKSTNKDLDASYYRVAGIHGQPYTSWQGAGGEQPATFYKGYCCHTSVLFPTWHRPYLALYEQILVKHAQDAAVNMPPEWQRKADSFRLPYWDWAQKLIPPSEIMSDTTLDILRPDGTTEVFENPFLNYKFQPVPDFSPGGSAVTYRNPTFTDKVANEIRRSTLHLLNRTDSWEAMSNDGAGEDPHPNLASSLEQIHNRIHNKTGGFLGDTSIAAFDPIFWMHHANVDRLLAIWQAIHPSRWVTPSRVTEVSQTWNLGLGTFMDGSTPLLPFWNGITSDSAPYWSSNESRTISSFGYTYPELKDNPSSFSLMAHMERLYGRTSARPYITAAAALPQDSSESLTLRAAAESFSEVTVDDVLLTADVPENAHSLNIAKGVLLALAPALAYEHRASDTDIGRRGANQRQNCPLTLPIGSLPSNAPRSARTGLLDWSVRVRVEKYALKTSFDVVIFLLPPDVPADEAAISITDSNAWFDSPYYIGSVSAFVNSQPEHCVNCQNAIAQNLRIEGFVNLNQAIVDICGLRSFAVDVVHPYLKENLTWRVRKVQDGSIVPVEEISSLEVTVWSSELRVVSEIAPLPAFQPSRLHSDVTATGPRR